VPGKAPDVKTVGMAEVGTPISQDGVAVYPDCWWVCLCYLHFTQKIRKMANKDMTFGYYPVGTPTCLRKQEVEKPSWNAAQPCARAQGCENDDLRADGLRKGWQFRVSTWNVDSLTGRSGEVVEALSDRKVDVACIQET